MNKFEEMQKILKKKKVDVELIKYHCKGKYGYLTYNAFQKKDKYKLTKEEYLLFKEGDE